MNLRSLRITIVIFMLGASGWNLLTARGEYAWLGDMTAPPGYSQVPTTAPETPTQHPHLIPGTAPPTQYPHLMPGLPTPTPDPEAVAAYQAHLQRHNVITNEAAKREVLILTRAGIAWFL